MVATARRLAAMPISAIVVQRPTAAVLRSGNTAAREPSQRLDVVGRGSLTLGNQIAPVNRNFVTVQPPIIDAKKLRPRFESRTVKQRRPRRLRSPPLPPSDAMTGVPPKIGSERVGMMKSSRLAVVIASPIRGKSAMSLRQWQECWNERYQDCYWSICKCGWGCRYPCRKCKWKTRRKCETRREYAYRTVNTGDTSCNDQWSVWGLISSGWN